MLSVSLEWLAKNFIIHNGRIIRFWTDIWHPLGRIIELTGEVGAQKLGTTRDAKICDVVRDNEWEIRTCRDAQIRTIVDSL